MHINVICIFRSVAQKETRQWACRYIYWNLWQVFAAFEVLPTSYRVHKTDVNTLCGFSPNTSKTEEKRTANSRKVNEKGKSWEK